jgi:hypothetical protein
MHDAVLDPAACRALLDQLQDLALKDLRLVSAAFAEESQ